MRQQLKNYLKNYTIQICIQFAACTLYFYSRIVPLFKILAKFNDYIGTSKKGKKTPFPADAIEQLGSTEPIIAEVQLFVDCFP